MKLIAHRGLTTGPNKDLENRPSQVLSVLDNGFDCEIDFWVVDDRFYLGHDGPQFHVKRNFIEDPRYWIHAKNLEALYYLIGTELNFFWHQNDDFTVTNSGHIWTYPGKPLTEDSVMVLPEWEDPTLENVKHATCFAVCSDFVKLLK
jgi:hypothetical protein